MPRNDIWWHVPLHSLTCKEFVPGLFVCAVIDWIILGTYMGLCKSEWCNDNPVDFKKITDPQWGTHTTSLAIIVDDFHFATATSSCFHDIHHIEDTDIIFTTLCICKQKNNNTLQTKNTGNLPVHSSVQWGYRSHPEWSFPVMLMDTSVPEGYRSLPVGYWKFKT